LAPEIGIRIEKKKGSLTPIHRQGDFSIPLRVQKKLQVIFKAEKADVFFEISHDGYVTLKQGKLLISPPSF
jgi:hypothetical protein